MLPRTDIRALDRSTPGFALDGSSMDGLLTRYEEQLAHDHSASSRSAIPVRYGLFFMGLGAGLTLVVQGAFQSLQFAHQSSQELARPWATSEALKTPSQYVATQLHGFEIFTFPGSEDDGCPRESLFDENSNCYLGLEDVYADANRRVDIMLQAVDSAHAAGKTNHSNSVLKVFLAPEFFFRGPAGAYRTDDLVDGRVNCLNRLYDYVTSDSRFDDWLFVFGTVVAASPPHTRFSGQDPSRWAFHNFAPIVRGGKQESCTSTIGMRGCGWLVFKSYISSIDFLDFPESELEKRGDDVRYSAVLRAEPRGDGTYAHTPKEMHDLLGSRWVVLDRHQKRIDTDGLRIGVEICLDHSTSDLQKELQAEAEALGLEHIVPLDLQLIVSAGLQMADGPILTRPGAPTFHVDGRSRSQIGLNVWGHGADRISKHVSAYGENVWFTELGPDPGLYNMGATAWHDSSLMLRATVGAIFELFFKSEHAYDTVDFFPPAGWVDAFVLEIEEVPVGDFSDPEYVASFGELFLTLPYLANMNAFQALLEGLAPKVNLSPEELAAVIKKEVGVEARDFGPSVSVYPTVSISPVLGPPWISTGSL